MENINIHTDFTKLSHGELLQIKEKWDPVSQVYLLTVSELHRRQQIDKDKAEQTQKKTDKTQKDIKTMTAIIMILTVIILIYTVALYFRTP